MREYVVRPLLIVPNGRFQERNIKTVIRMVITVLANLLKYFCILTYIYNFCIALCFPKMKNNTIQTNYQASSLQTETKNKLLNEFDLVKTSR
jgi:hypothetical protein